MNQSVTIGVNIKNPHTFYHPNTSGYSYCPNTTPYNNSWSAKNKDMWSGATSTDNIVIKTIYDPCPMGYTVAPLNTFSTFKTANWDDTNKGQTLGGLWFPATGRRNSNSGTLDYVGNYGYFWQAVPYAATYARVLRFINSGDPNPVDREARAYGFPVRPVKEID